jgi:hypothetical protein
MKCVATGYGGLSRQGSLEERLKVLEDYSENLAKNISDIHRKLDKIADEARETVTTESKERKRVDNEIKTQMDRVFMDGIQLQFAGAAYVFFGTCLSS